MQALIRAHGAPENGLLRRQFLFLGIMRLAVVDVKMHHPFHEAYDQCENNWRTHDHKNQDRAKAMHPSVLCPASMQIGPAPRKHFCGLQEKVGKEVFDLQKAEQ